MKAAFSIPSLVLLIYVFLCSYFMIIYIKHRADTTLSNDSRRALVILVFTSFIDLEPVLPLQTTTDTPLLLRSQGLVTNTLP